MTKHSVGRAYYKVYSHLLAIPLLKFTILKTADSLILDAYGELGTVSLPLLKAPKLNFAL